MAVPSMCQICRRLFLQGVYVTLISVIDIVDLKYKDTQGKGTPGIDDQAFIYIKVGVVHPPPTFWRGVRTPHLAGYQSLGTPPKTLRSRALGQSS